MDQKHPLFWVERKIAHADSRLDEFKVIIEDFQRLSQAAFRVEKHDGTAYYIGTPSTEKLAGIAIRIGEIGVQLRSALDKMISELAVLHGKSGRSMAFPFGGTDPTTGQAQPFPTPGTKANLEKKIGPIASQWIIGHKPHPSGDETLWSINQIANTDKHHAGMLEIRPQIAKGVAVHSLIVDGEPEGPIPHFTRPDWPDVITRQNEWEYILGAIASDQKITASHSVALKIHFGEIAPMVGEEVITVLDAHIEKARSILSVCQTEFF